jgi:hypothetical protein
MFITSNGSLLGSVFYLLFCDSTLSFCNHCAIKFLSHSVGGSQLFLTLQQPSLPRFDRMAGASAKFASPNDGLAERLTARTLLFKLLDGF